MLLPPRQTNPLRRSLAAAAKLPTLLFWIAACTPATFEAPISPTEAAPRVAGKDSDSSAASSPSGGTSRLVLWLTVDQMRGDYLEKYGAHFSNGGFRRLLEKGVWYKNAHYGHAITETAPGHATLFTGAAPRQHGIVGNSWLDQDGNEIASVLDASAPLIGPGVGKKQEPADGRSPRLLLVPTVGDELFFATGGRAHIISLSMKDRGAILPGGKKGRAVWMGDEGFVTSEYYGGVPEWVGAHHEARPPVSYIERGWPLLLQPDAYQNAPAMSDHADEALGKGFPHRIPTGMAPVKALKQTPFGDEAVLDLARFAIESEGLGGDEVVDLLALSLSSTDVIGHYYGIESRELEDQLVRLDRSLGAFFTYLDEKVGQGSYSVVLSADHGGAESVEYSKAQGLEATRVTEAALERAAEEILAEKYGKKSYLVGVASPYVVLRRVEIQNDGRDLLEVRKVVADSIRRVPGVRLAHVVGAPLSDDANGRRIEAALHPERSGDVYVVPGEHSLLLQSEGFAATHGSPWNYDTHVPILVASPGGPHGIMSDRAVDVRSLAPTVAALMGISAPSGATLEPLAP